MNLVQKVADTTMYTMYTMRRKDRLGCAPPGDPGAVLRYDMTLIMGVQRTEGTTSTGALHLEDPTKICRNC